MSPQPRLFEAVLGRNELIGVYKSLDYEAALISIWTPGDYERLKVTNPEAFQEYTRMDKFFTTKIRQEFWDTENNVPGYDTISPEQANSLVDFIIMNTGRTYAIHCDAGQSRSAGVALAIECIIKHNGDRYQAGLAPSYTDHERYSPNRKVHDIIMDAWDRRAKRNKKVKDESG